MARKSLEDIKDNPLISETVRLLTNLPLIPFTEGNSLYNWREDSINYIDNLLENEIEAIKNINNPFQLAISLSTILAFLVSQEFDSYFIALTNNDWSGFQSLYKEYASSWDVANPLYIKAMQDPEFEEDIFIPECCDFLSIEHFGSGQIYEKLMFFRVECSRGERLLHKPPVRILNKNDKWPEGIVVSINPYSGINSIISSIKEIFDFWKVNYIKDISESWKNEYSQGIIDDDFIKKEILEALVSLGDKETFKVKKQTRAIYTILTDWRVSLRVYYMKKRKANWREIIKQSWWNGSSTEEASKHDIPRKYKLAKNLVATALRGDLLFKSNSPR